MTHDRALEDMAVRGRWLLERLSERNTPDGRCVLEISGEPIWVKPDATFREYIAAVDRAIEADESFQTTQWDTPRKEAA